MPRSNETYHANKPSKAKGRGKIRRNAYTASGLAQPLNALATRRAAFLDRMDALNAELTVNARILRENGITLRADWSTLGRDVAFLTHMDALNVAARGT